MCCERKLFVFCFKPTKLAEWIVIYNWVELCALLQSIHSHWNTCQLAAVASIICLLGTCTQQLSAIREQWATDVILRTSRHRWIIPDLCQGTGQTKPRTKLRLRLLKNRRLDSSVDFTRHTRSMARYLCVFTWQRQLSGLLCSTVSLWGMNFTGSFVWIGTVAHFSLQMQLVEHLRLDIAILRPQPTQAN